MANRCEPPWFLIARSALRGVPLESLSVRYEVPVEDIRSRLDVAIAKGEDGSFRLRTTKEIDQASVRARNDLVAILIESIDELVLDQNPRLKNIDKLIHLTNVSSKLFGWSSGAGSNQRFIQPYVNQNNTPTEAVNLALIATTPAQLAALAKAKVQEENQGKILGDAQSKSQESKTPN